MSSLVNRRFALKLAAAAGAGAGSITESAFAAKHGRIPMSDSVGGLCQRYYAAWRRKDLDGILACLDPNVVFISPNANSRGRDAYATATRRFLPLVTRVDLRGTFVAHGGAMAALNFHCIEPIGISPVAELIGVTNGLIAEDQIFFDPRPFEAFARAHANRSKHL